MSKDNLFTDGQTQPKALSAFRAAGRDLKKLVKNHFLRFRRESHASIFYLYRNGFVTEPAGAYYHASVFGRELQSVMNKVPNHLTDASSVDHNKRDGF